MSSADDDSFSKTSLRDYGVESASSEEDETSSFIILPKKKEPAADISNAIATKPDPKEADPIVEFQLPPHFSTGGVVGSAAYENHTTAADSASLPSEASSFMPVRSFGKLKMCHDFNEENNSKSKSKNGLDVNTGKVKGASNLKTEEGDANTKMQTGLEKLFLPKAAAKDSDDEASDWSVISSVHGMKGKTNGSSNCDSAKEDDANSVAASSTISGFDLISLNGSSSRRPCPRCSFLNDSDDSICKGCYFAFVANPNRTADEELARCLQQQEEQEAFAETLYRQKKRDSLGQEPVLFRARTLANDVVSVLEACRATIPSYSAFEGVGFSTLPHASLTVLASRFIDCVDEKIGPSKDVSPVTLCYCYSGKDSETMSRIRQDGFEPRARFGSTPEAAMKAFKKYGRGRSKLFGKMETICELGSTMKSVMKKRGHSFPEKEMTLEGGSGDDHRPSAIQGWIVAIVRGVRSSDVSVTSGRAIVYAQERSDQSLPLVSFDAALFDKDIIRRLLNGLTTVCRDFFNDCAQSVEEAVTSYDDFGDSKRRKLSSGADGVPSASLEDDKQDDEAIALALQASLYEDSDSESTRDIDSGSEARSKTETDSFSPTPCKDGLVRVSVHADDPKEQDLYVAAASLESFLEHD